MVESVKAEDRYITCPRCNYLVPRTPVCMYCGAELPSITPLKKLGEPQEMSANAHFAAETGPRSADSWINYLLWRVKLLQLLNEGRISRGVFERIYNDYTLKIDRLIAKRGRPIEDLGEVFSEAKLREVRDDLEELRVRRTLGEVTDSGYAVEYSRTRSKLAALEGEVTRVKLQYKQLNKMVSSVFGEKDFSELRGQIEHCQNNLSFLVSRNVIDEKMVAAIKRDLEQTAKILDSERMGQGTPSEPKGRLLELEEAAPFDEDLLFEEVTRVVKGHGDEIRRIIRAIKMRDNVLILGRQGEGKTELLLQLHKLLGGAYLHCHEEISEREIVAGFNPSAIVGKNPVHKGCLMQIINGSAKGLPIAFIDAIMKLRPKAQILLLQAMNNKTFTNPIDGKAYYLPPEFAVVSSSNLESVVQETPDTAFLDRFGKIVMWKDTGDDAIRETLRPYNLPAHLVDFLIWVRNQVARMRYLVPVSVRNLCKFAQEYNTYRELYQKPEELRKLAVDRLLKMRTLNVFGLKEFEEAKNKIDLYIKGKPWRVL